MAKAPKDVMLASVEMWTQQVTDKTEARDRAIYLASQEGASLREIAEVSGMSHSTVKTIVDRMAEIRDEQRAATS